MHFEILVKTRFKIYLKVRRDAIMLYVMCCICAFYPLVAGTQVQRNSRVVALSWRALWIFSRNKLWEDDIIRVVPRVWHIKSGTYDVVLLYGTRFFCILHVIGTSRFHTVKIFCAKKKDDRFDVN